MSEPDTVVPCEGGPDRRVGWLRVPVPLPLEVDRDDGGVYVLDERSDGAVYATWPHDDGVRPQRYQPPSESAHVRAPPSSGARSDAPATVTRR